MKSILCLFAFAHMMSTLWAAGTAAPAKSQYSATAITDGFVTEWVTTKDAQQILIPILPLIAGSYNYDVNWGDGSSSNSQTGDAVHTYQLKGTYTVTITGDFPAIQFNSSSSSSTNDALIHAVLQWGNGTWHGMDAAFMNCINLQSVPNKSGPVFAPNSTLYCMFNNCQSFNGDLDKWDLSNVRETANMFQNATSFNGNISTWDVHNVTNMQYMFYQATRFNGNIAVWDVAKVLYFQSMFESATAFSGDISKWVVVSATTMNRMFQNASSFDSDMGSWDVQNVTDISHMFDGATSFNQDISGWNVANVTSMGSAFLQASSFNQNLGSWNIGNVTDMNAMLNYSGLSIENYEATLRGWATQSVKTNVDLGAHGLKYCDNSAHNTLSDQYNWVIEGDQRVCLVPAVPDANGIVYVDSTAAANGDGSSWTRALRQLSNATESARENTAIKEVHVAKGTYFPPGEQSYTARDSSFRISRSGLKLLGGFPNGGGVRNAETQRTILSGDLGVKMDNKDNSNCILSIMDIPETDSLLVDGFVITGGAVTQSDGVYDIFRIGCGVALSNAYANTVLNHCKILDNHSILCSGISVMAYSEVDYENLKMADPQILNCLIQNNDGTVDAASGNYGYGAAFWNANAAPYVYNCDFTGNKGAFGGANISYLRGTPIFDHCKFTGNIASIVPVSISFSSSAPKFINCLMNNNLAIGLAPQWDGEQLVDYDFYNNAIIVNLNYSSSSLVNCTVVNNKGAITPASKGGVIFNGEQSNAYITNSIFWGNPNSVIADSATTIPSVVSYNLMEGTAADATTHMLDGTGHPAIFTDSANGDYSLVAAGPAVDAGLNDSLFAVLGTHLNGMGNGGTDLAFNQRIVNDVIDLGAYELLAGSLPVKASALTGKLDLAGQALLSWATYTESYNKGFYVQVSKDGINFQDLDFLPSRALNGLSNGTLNYSYNAGLLNGTVYYRFIQMDQNGTKRSSNIIRLSSTGLAFKVLAYPNPVQNKLHITIKGQRGAGAGLTLLDAVGKVTRRVTVQGSDVQLDMQGLPAGIYIVRYQDEEHSVILKVVKQ